VQNIAAKNLKCRHNLCTLVKDDILHIKPSDTAIFISLWARNYGTQTFRQCVRFWHYPI